ncbi:hypothetical protein CPLU01_03831 [Colletotrichum plurivorum]|uniref:Uncharacterized protein n=1 Tax=Colletotrichum plurivorum TaxID=2175906 RepID=A0A8H6NJP9_9PEZI|nr:hypothetical protein CPLU01_03831 [Colletotrichum plurivorum]
MWLSGGGGSSSNMAGQGRAGQEQWMYPYPHPVQQVHKPTAPSSTTTPPIPICAGGLDWGPAGKAQGREVDAMACLPARHGMAWQHGKHGT